MAKILITGGAGFIGSALALRLLDEGHQVSVLDNLSPQIHGEEPEQSALYLRIADRVTFCRGDICDRTTLEKALADCDAVVHFAAETGTGQSMYQIGHYCSVNVGGTALLLDILASRPHSVRRILVASSRAIYGEGRYRSETLGHVWPGPRNEADMASGDFEPKVEGAGRLELVATDEDSRIHPTSVYGITKQVQEQLVLTAAPAARTEGVALRFQNVYGPGQSLSNPYTGILSIFSNRMLAGQAINIFEDGAESRDFLFIDDAVEASMRALFTPGVAGQALNVGTGQPISVLTVARTLARELEVDVPIEVSGNFRIGDIRHNYACTKRAEALLGFRAAVPFEQGAAALAKWARAQGVQSSGYDRSLTEMRERGLLK